MMHGTTNIKSCPQCCQRNRFPLFTLYILRMPIALFGTLDDIPSNSFFENYIFIQLLSPDLLHHENNELIYLAKRDKRIVSQKSFHAESPKIIVTTPRNLRLRDEESGFLIPIRFFCSSERPNWDPRSILFSGYLGVFPGLNRPGYEVNHSSPFSVEVKNKWNCTSTLHGVDREKCTRKLPMKIFTGY